jgi:hypothetical protein
MISPHLWGLVFMVNLIDLRDNRETIIHTSRSVYEALSKDDWHVRLQLNGEDLLWMWAALSTTVDVKIEQKQEEEVCQGVKAWLFLSGLCLLLLPLPMDIALQLSQCSCKSPCGHTPVTPGSFQAFNLGLGLHHGPPCSEASFFLDWATTGFFDFLACRWQLWYYPVSKCVNQSNKSSLIIIYMSVYICAYMLCVCIYMWRDRVVYIGIDTDTDMH